MRKLLVVFDFAVDACEFVGPSRTTLDSLRVLSVAFLSATIDGSPSECAVRGGFRKMPRTSLMELTAYGSGPFAGKAVLTMWSV